MVEHTDRGISTGAYADLPVSVARARIADLGPSAEIYSSGAHSLLDRKNAAAAFDLDMPFSVHGPLAHDGLGNPYEPESRAAVRLHRRHMKVASRLGATLYIVHPDLQARPAPPNPEIVHALEWSFEELRALQDDLGLPVAVENMAESHCSHFRAPGDDHLHARGLLRGTSAGVEP